jgi:Ca2+/H+ antiporter, TMEM165/GDT1 family
MIHWTHIGPSVVAAFLASLVEFVEAMTVVLAVGAVRGWSGALAGSGLALVTLLVMVAVMGPALIRVPLDIVQLLVGTLLLLFGMRWLRKAILRAAGIIRLHDEAATYVREEQALRKVGGTVRRWDGVALTTAFKITMIEGIEVVFIVLAVGAAGHGLLVPASVGALAALVLVVLLGLVLHRPVASIPENALKFVVGLVLTSFGTFWFGEGIGLPWPGGDWSLLALFAGYTVVALTAVRICQKSRERAASVASTI